MHLTEAFKSLTINFNKLQNSVEDRLSKVEMEQIDIQNKFIQFNLQQIQDKTK